MILLASCKNSGVLSSVVKENAAVQHGHLPTHPLNTAGWHGRGFDYKTRASLDWIGLDWYIQ